MRTVLVGVFGWIVIGAALSHQGFVPVAASCLGAAVGGGVAMGYGWWRSPERRRRRIVERLRRQERF